jgi:dihydroorotase
MKNSLLITNARMVNEGQQFEGDLLINNGRIENIAASISSPADRTIDANGRLLIPGMIDDQVHFREPGLTRKADIACESRAAVAGGITSFMEMPNTAPPTTNAAAVEHKCEIASRGSLGNYAFYLGATNHNLADIQAQDPGKVAGIKVFMGASTGNLLVDDPDALEGVFREAPCLVATHCEDSPMIDRNHQQAIAKYGADLPISQHPIIRSAEACYKSSSLAVSLAGRHNTRLHVLHLTTARELELFSNADLDDKHITVEVCAHHLWFDQGDYAERGNLIKCNPAIKTAEDRKALLAAVAAGVIDVIATDHAPHTWEEKQASYAEAPAGLPLVQDALPSVLEHYFNGDLTLERIVEATSHSVARLFQVQERGFLREGYWADLALIDLDRPRTVERAEVLSKCGWTPFEGIQFSSSVAATVVNGHLAWLDGKIDDSHIGQRLQFVR